MSEKALITGASSGIGRALAKRMASRGVEVWVAARRLPMLEALVAEIAAAGGRAHAVVLDVADATACHDAVRALDESVGGFDVVVANAGIGSGGIPLSRSTWGEGGPVLQIDFVSAIATLQAPLARMVRDRRGHIVAVSSLAAHLPMPVAAHYGAAKAGLSFFMRCAYMALSPYNVHTTAIHPGFIRTELTANAKFQMPFLMDVDDAAAIFDRGIVRKKRYVRAPWQMALLMGLFALLPDAIVGFLARRAAPK